jgi:hypothetical protein
VVEERDRNRNFVSAGAAEGAIRKKCFTVHFEPSSIAPMIPDLYIF